MRLHDDRVLARALARVPEAHGAVDPRGREGLPGAGGGALPLHVLDGPLVALEALLTDLGYSM